MFKYTVKCYPSIFTHFFDVSLFFLDELKLSLLVSREIYKAQ